MASLEKPLAYDAGDYLYVADIFLDGGTPYTEVAHSKGPVSVLIYAVVATLGDHSVLLVRLTLSVAVALTALGLAAYVSRAGGRDAGLVAGFAFAALGSTSLVQGDDPNTEQYGLALMVGAWWLASRGGIRSAVGAGALAMAATLTNVGFAVIGLFVLIELWRVRGPASRKARLLGVVGGGLLVVCPILLWLGIAGALGDMWIQTIEFATDAVGSGETVKASGETLADFPDPGLLAVPARPLWAAGMFGSLVALLDPRLRYTALIVAMWIVVMWARVKVNSYEFPHHYYLAMPGIAAGLALGMASVWGPTARQRISLAAMVLAVPVATYVVEEQRNAFSLPARERWGPGNPQYGLAYPVSDFIREHTDHTDPILVAGMPTVYWLSDRQAPTRFLVLEYARLNEPEWPHERRRDLLRNPPAAIAQMPDNPMDVQTRGILKRFRYRLSFEEDGAKVWLRPDRVS